MNHGDAAPVVAGDIVHVSFLSHGAQLKKKSKLPLRLRLGAVLGRVLLPLWFGASHPVYVAPPSWLLCHELLHRLWAPGIVVRRLIALFGPDFRVSYVTEALSRVHGRCLPSRLRLPLCAHQRWLSSR